jgi:ADP-ribose pyrophosphatase YjhB (NUDIX family)
VRIHGWARSSANSKNTATVVPASQVNQIAERVCLWFGTWRTDPVRVILLRDTGRTPPGGVLELGEQFEDGVRREVREETGLDVHVDRLTGVYKNLRLGVVALVFRCTPLGTVHRDSAEAVAVRWVDPDQVTALMDPAYAVRVTDAFGDTAVTRTHDGVQLLSA